ncbi:MAG TPA: hypothetical protein PKA41_10035, partial [Verrucomicrobiota bacterium]|nr:hypothetical protein [Verrucomicrobiota bacterium]
QQNGAMITSFFNASASRYQLMRFNALGAIDETFATAPGFDSSVFGTAMTPSGDLYVAGFFSSVSGVPVQGLAKIRAAATNVPPTAPNFTLLPSSSDYASNATATLRTAAVGAAPMNFFWFKDGSPVASGTNMLVLPNFNAALAGNYQVVASNSFGSVTSAVASITTASPPVITQQPPATTGSTNGGTVFLSITATGTEPMSYQWYRNSGSVFGATNSSHTISNLSSGTAGNWHAIVTNLYGRATSSVSMVLTGATPGIFSQPANQTLNGTGNVSLQVIASASSTFPLNFFWYKGSTLVYTWTTNANNLGSTYVISNALPADAGQYHVIISNFVGTVTSLVRTVTINNPFLAVQPVNTTVVLGGTTNFTALATGTTPIDYYWYHRFGSPVVTNFVGNGTNLTIANATKTDGQGTYFVVASNVWGSVQSGSRNLTVQYPPAVTNIFTTNVVAELNAFASFSVQYEGEPSPTLRWYKDGVFQPTLSSGFVSFPSVQSSNAGVYQLALSNYLGSVTSAPIVLTVLPARGPTITNDPASRTFKVGDFVSLNVEADGTPTMQYGWFKQGAGQVTAFSSSPNYGFTASATNQSGGYYVVVTNAYGSDTSAVAQVTIIQPQPAVFAGKQFVKIADSTMTIPGLGTNKFGGFRDAFLRNGQVWFGGVIPSVPFSVGVYHWSNSVLAGLVNTNTTVPGSAEKFTNFYGSTFLSANKVVFGGNGTGNKHGLYAWTNGNVITMHDTTTIMPGRAENFDRFGWPTVVGDQFAFLGFHDWNENSMLDYRGVYISSNGVLTKLADTNTALPNLGGRWVGSSSQVGFDGNIVAWWAINEATNGGIFTVNKSSTVASRADEATINPANGLLFDGFISPPNVTTGRVYLVGHDPSFNTTLLYRDPAGPLTVIAKPGDTIPSRGMAFDSVGYPFQASTPDGNFFDGNDGYLYTGIFYWNGSTIVKVVDSLDTLDGLAIQYVYVADAEDDCVLFYVGFTNGRQALYATLPAAGSQTFNQWAANYTFPPGESDPEDNPDGDALINAFEYYFGSNPTIGGSGNPPSGTTVNVSGTVYPAITFVRSQSATGVTLLPQASSSLNFTDSLGTTVHSVVDLGGGLERVTIRSTVSVSGQSSQFLRIQLTIP